MKNYQIHDNRSKPDFFRLLRDTVVFRLIVYSLYMNCLNLQFLYKILKNINFPINLTQFYFNFSRKEHQIELLWVSIIS